MNIRRFDLNLLLVFDALNEHGQVTLAARALGVTQPAVSNSLRRLREIVGDPLFVRSGNAMRPTARARAMRNPVRHALGQLAGALGEAAFSPGSASHQVRIAMADDIERLLLPGIVRELGRQAPGISVVSRRVAALFELPVELLGDSFVDFAIGPFGLPPRPSTDIHGRLLYRDSFVCITGKSNRALRGSLTLRRLVDLRHVAILYPSAGSGLMDQALAAHGLSRRVAVVVPHMATAVELVASSDLCATVPKRFASKLVGRLPIVLHQPPIDLPTIEVGIFWHARSGVDPALSWSRETIIKAVTHRACPGPRVSAGRAGARKSVA